MTSQVDIDQLANAFAGRLLTDDADIGPFVNDWLGRFRGNALAVAQPDTTEDLAAVVRWCAAHGVPMVPQGGNTGMAGGATPDDSGQALVVSTSRLNRIRAVDPVNNTIEVEAGSTLAAVQDAAAGADRHFPLSLAAEGTATIGGNLATNAGGVHVVRYGSARDLCLGLEVVTPAGDVWNGLRGLRKDNTGYDLRNLYIGSEGTLGIITAAVLKLFPAPPKQNAAFLAVQSVRLAVDFLHSALDHLGPDLTALEIMSRESIAIVNEHRRLSNPIESDAEWFLLLETTAERDRLEALLDDAIGSGTITAATISASAADFKAFWDIRESITEAQGSLGAAIKHDIALPISALADFIETVGPGVAEAFRHVRPIVFGHLGDGNLHFNFSPRPGSNDADLLASAPALNRLVHDQTDSYGGSISAEHGLGVLRRDEAARYKTDVELDLMRAIKTALDPNNLMNPGKVL